MAHLLSLLRRHSIARSHLLRSSFCSSSSPPPIKPICYPLKPNKEEAAPEAQQQPQQTPSSPSFPLQADRDSSPQRQWASRQDARFVKDAAPAISPVSYPSRVAPLPEDRAAAAEGDADEGQGDGEELRRESRQIVRTAPGYFGLREEEKLPFPTVAMREKRPQKQAVDLATAIKEVKANAKRKFTETVEAHVNLGVDPRRGDQMVRGAVTLPHGTGKTVRIAVFAEGPAADEARAAGADIVGGDELIEEIKNGGGKLNFDKCIATPMFVPRLSKIGRILGPRGLMPNPKLGSVTSDVSGAIKEAKCGRVDFKIDKTAIVHVGLGKVNFSEECLQENIGAFVNALLLAKPVGLKKTSKYAGYVKKFTLSSTMGPGFPITVQSLSVAADNYNKVKVK
ncbi:putative 50S ribosomal protein L1 [Iris pallida]|uniref:Ribosomal protein n=1 Tax=Iris pallida TaxID=29817 RepID=A0AAX6DPK1_IRIPA|nr:putative 50S ribosomal protein L1 [Iris pallida]